MIKSFKSKIKILLRSRYQSQITIQAYLSFRPYVFDLLEDLKENFELILFARSDKAYVQAALEAFKAKGDYFDYVLHKKHCFKCGHEAIKSLEVLMNGRSMKDTFVVDHQVTSFMVHMSSGVLVEGFDSEKKANDRVLRYLGVYLNSFLEVKDVRDKIEKDFGIKERLQEYMGKFKMLTL